MKCASVIWDASSQPQTYLVKPPPYSSAVTTPQQCSAPYHHTPHANKSLMLHDKFTTLVMDTMLCCGRRKEPREAEMAVAVEGGEGGQLFYSMPSRRACANNRPRMPPGQVPEMVIQSDFRKISGISGDVFRQIEAVENAYDAQTAANLEAVERRGEMIIRLLDPRTLGRVGVEFGRRYIEAASSSRNIRFVEIIKRPGQTLGLYIREGDAPFTYDGVYISRIALESPVYSSGLLKVGDEILAVNLVDIRQMSLDDVVIIMSIPRRLVLTIRSQTDRERIIANENPYSRGTLGRGGISMHSVQSAMLGPVEKPRPVVVIKKEVTDNDEDNQESLHQSQYNYMKGNTNPFMDPMGLPKSDYYRTISTQPRMQHSYPKTLENLAEQVHQFHTSPRKPQQRVDPPPYDYTRSISRSSMISGPPRTGMSGTLPHSNPSTSKYNPALQSLALERARMLRTESEQRLSSLRDPTFNRYYSLSLRTGKLGGKPVNSQSSQILSSREYLLGENPSFGYSATLGPAGIRRSSLIESTSSHDMLLRNRGPGMPRSFSGIQRSPGRCNSLPRVRTAGIITAAMQAAETDYRRQRHMRYGRESAASYDSQDESDGALSAPEYSEKRRRSSPRATSKYGTIAGTSDYTEWARRNILNPSPSGFLKTSRSISRSAHSTDSILDSLRQEQQRLLMTGSKPDFKTMGRSPSGGLGSRPPHIPHAYSMDYIRLPHLRPSADGRGSTHLIGSRTDLLNRRAAQQEEQTNQLSGVLWVHLLAARGLRATTPHKEAHLRDLYCVIECDRVHKARTVVRTGDHSFDWNEVFELDLVDNVNAAFLLYSWDPQSRHRLCYKGTINLVQALKDAPVYNIALKLEPRGSLYIKLRYRNIKQTFQRLPSPSPQTAVFGVPLDALVLRERSPDHVPLILKRCIQEVEKRGLDIVGIYRLCGSALRKKILREAFERNAWTVDLSADHVPDINVITSLIKDYLRELPEPLFTKGLFDMLVDGLSVCLPDDPSGNARLMFSILDCLPKMNRATATFLLDHLKLVVSRSEVNKVTPQSLAVSFGPILMCHTKHDAITHINKPIEIIKYLIELWPESPNPTSASASNGGTTNNVPTSAANTSSINVSMSGGDEQRTRPPAHPSVTAPTPPATPTSDSDVESLSLSLSQSKQSDEKSTEPAKG